MAMLKVGEAEHAIRGIPPMLREWGNDYDSLDEKGKAWFVVMFVQYMYALHEDLGEVDGEDIEIPRSKLIEVYTDENRENTKPEFGRLVKSLIFLRNALCHMYFKKCAMDRLKNMWCNNTFLEFLSIHDINVVSNINRKEDTSIAYMDNNEMPNPIAVALAKMSGDKKGDILC